MICRVCCSEAAATIVRAHTRAHTHTRTHLHFITSTSPTQCGTHISMRAVMPGISFWSGEDLINLGLISFTGALHQAVKVACKARVPEECIRS